MATKLVSDGVLPLLVLSIVDAGIDYAYEIKRAMERNRIHFSEGTIYTALRRYEARGFIASAGHDANPRKRRHYSLTELGRQMLARWREELDVLQTALIVYEVSR